MGTLTDFDWTQTIEFDWTAKVNSSGDYIFDKLPMQIPQCRLTPFALL
ncbi:hypothetical protein LAWASA_3701 [Lawsonibacter asaccharolyticus]|nr:hypothetical protein LAWASA_3701 [Lawsonibacter asaccharolyticus]